MSTYEPSARKPGFWAYAVAYLFGSVLGALAAEMVNVPAARAESPAPTAQRSQADQRAPRISREARELAAFLHTDTLNVQIAGCP